MAITYRDTRTGKVAHAPEPTDFEGQRGARKKSMHARRVIEKMDTSKRWERISDAEAETAEREYAQRRAARSPGRQAQPTPVYVVNTTDEPEQAKPQPRPEPQPRRAPEPASAFTQGGGRPAHTDPKAAWIDYAASQGIERGEAENMTKAELVERLS